MFIEILEWKSLRSQSINPNFLPVVLLLILHDWILATASQALCILKIARRSCQMHLVLSCVGDSAPEGHRLTHIFGIFGRLRCSCQTLRVGHTSTCLEKGTSLIILKSRSLPRSLYHWLICGASYQRAGYPEYTRPCRLIHRLQMSDRVLSVRCEHSLLGLAMVVSRYLLPTRRRLASKIGGRSWWWLSTAAFTSDILMRLLFILRDNAWEAWLNRGWASLIELLLLQLRWNRSDGCWSSSIEGLLLGQRAPLP